MLHEVGEALLSVRLVQGTRGDVEAKRRLARWRGLLADGVAHAVGKDAESEGGVRRHVGAGLGPGGSFPLGRARALGPGQGGTRAGEGQPHKQDRQDRRGKLLESGHELRGLPDLSRGHGGPKIMARTRRLQAFGDLDARLLDGRP